MKTFTAVALALVVGAGIGYGSYAMMNEQTNSEPSESIQAAQNMANEVANTEPAAGEKVRAADDVVVGKVDGKEIFRSDVLAFIKTLPEQMRGADPKSVFPMALDQVVSGRIVDEKAKVEGVENDPLVVSRLNDAKVQIVRSVYAEKAIEKEMTPDAVKKAYEDIVKSIPKVEEANARHILVDSEDKAKEIIAKLNEGKKFEDLAKEFSKDKSNSENGGDLGYFTQTDMVKEFSDAAFALKAKEYTKTPVKTQFGYHVIQLLDKRERPAPKFEDVKMQVEGQVRRDILNKLIEKWRSEAKVEQFDYDGKPIVAAPAPAAAPAVAPAEAPKKAE